MAPALKTAAGRDRHAVLVFGPDELVAFEEPCLRIDEHSVSDGFDEEHVVGFELKGALLSRLREWGSSWDSVSSCLRPRLGTAGRASDHAMGRTGRRRRAPGRPRRSPTRRSSYRIAAAWSLGRSAPRARPPRHAADRRRPEERQASKNSRETEEPARTSASQEARGRHPCRYLERLFAGVEARAEEWANRAWRSPLERRPPPWCRR